MKPNVSQVDTQVIISAACITLVVRAAVLIERRKADARLCLRA